MGVATGLAGICVKHAAGAATAFMRCMRPWRAVCGVAGTGICTAGCAPLTLAAPALLLAATLMLMRARESAASLAPAADACIVAGVAGSLTLLKAALDEDDANAVAVLHL